MNNFLEECKMLASRLRQEEKETRKMLDSNNSDFPNIKEPSGQSNALLFDSAVVSILDSTDLTDFISNHAKENIADLKLRFSGKPLPFDLDFALTQIEARRKNHYKLSKFLYFPGFLFPSDLAAQQSTDQSVAEYHSELISKGSRWLDLTAGLGIDALSAAKAGQIVTAIEIESWKCDVLRHNAEIFLGQEQTENLRIFCDDATHFITETEPDEYDVVFIDPARRGQDDRRLYALSDCMPDITLLLPSLLKIAKTVIIKASPMLDVTEVLRRLPHIFEVKAISLNGECKELLIICKRDFTGIPSFEAVLLNKTGARVSFKWKSTIIPSNNECSISRVSETGFPDSHIHQETNSFKWLYEPDAALLKLNATSEILNRWDNLRKADPNSEIYLSENRIDGFPGREMEILKWISGKELKRLKGCRLAVVSRNFPEKSDSIRRKYGLQESQDDFLYAFRFKGKPVMLLTRRRSTQ